MPRKRVQVYGENGVEISKSSIKEGDKITISYSGLLASQGAQSIYAHVGYGDSWEEKSFIPMEKGKEAFKATFQAKLPGILNVSFKDGANNWDNNSMQNYSFKVSKKAATRKKTASKSSSTKKKTGSTAKASSKSTSKSKTKATSTRKKTDKKS